MGRKDFKNKKSVQKRKWGTLRDPLWEREKKGERKITIRSPSLGRVGKESERGGDVKSTLP